MQMIIYRCLSTGRSQGQYRLDNGKTYIISVMHLLVKCHQTFHSAHFRLYILKSKELYILILLLKQDFQKL